VEIGEVTDAWIRKGDTFDKRMCEVIYRWSDGPVSQFSSLELLADGGIKRDLGYNIL